MPGDGLRKLRPVAFVGSVLAAAALLGLGLFREEIGEVLFNAAML